MRILPISYVHNQNIHSKTKASPAFTAHPDFYGYNSIMSCYFRRGSVSVSCAEKYEDIENLFCKIFQANTKVPKNILIAGIGSSQEPFSYLTSIKGIIKNRLLKNNVDLYTVDLQSKPEHKTLKLNAFCDLHDYELLPIYAKNGFINDNIDDWIEIKRENKHISPTEEYSHLYLTYRDKWNELLRKGYSEEVVFKTLQEEDRQKHMRLRVNDEVFDFLENTYNNPEKSKWDSRIQDVIQTYPNDKFDIISANNILPYIISDSETAQTVKNIVKTLKPNGYFITDIYNHPRHIKELNKYDNIKKVDAGIYQKI